jgi:hypothetical protein
MTLDKKDGFMIDNFNRLVVKRGGETFPVDGSYSLDTDNQLVYWLNEPGAWRLQHELPDKIVFIGNWRLNDNYDLELSLTESQGFVKGDRLVIKGEIIATDRDNLVFEIKSYDKRGMTHIQLLKLSGVWQVDDYNRINFTVRKNGPPDTLTLEGAWQINENQQIIYNYEKIDLKKTDKVSQTFVFRGYWNISISRRLTYSIAHSTYSRFDFRAQVESPNLYPEKGEIKYRLGVGLRRDKAYQDKIISLFGTWKFSRKLGITFEIDYGQGQVRSMEFAANVSLGKGDKFIFSLIDKKGNPLGIAVTFTHQFLNTQDAEAFLRIKKALDNSTAVETGIRIPF